jgi:hypothetical protein
MIIKLTHKGKPTLVNFTFVVSLYSGIDKMSGRRMTFIKLSNGDMLMVDETLQETYDIYTEVMSGNKQGIDWTFVPPTFEERMESNFNSRRPMHKAYDDNERY